MAPTRRRRRILLASGALALFACYAYRVDESQVKTIASGDMDCDPAFLKLETRTSATDGVASYEVHGCGRWRTYDCTEDPNGRVECKTWHRPGVTESDGGAGSGVATGVAVAAGACACSKLFSGSHSSDPSSSPASTGNSMPTDPVRSQ